MQTKKKRFAVGSRVVISHGAVGVVTKVEDTPGSMGEYMHSIQTELGERREAGCSLELVPKAVSNVDSVHDKIPSVHFHGPNARLNIHSTDNSTNVSNVTSDSVFTLMREAASGLADGEAKNAIFARMEELEKAQGSESYLQAYKNLISSVADHMTIFVPFIPALTSFLSSQ